MRRITLLFLVLSAALAQAQSPEKCAAEIIYKQHFSADSLKYQRLEKQVLSYIEANKDKHTKSGEPAIITIPVVFHVVYNPLQDGSNLTNEILKSQLEVLNEDFRRLNSDTIKTRDIFKAIGSDIQIEFCMASVDPDGFPSEGITRKKSYQNFNALAFPDFVKFDSTGGTNAWPANEYLNIWTCDMSLIASQFIIGYAQFPGGNPLTDGVVVQWQYVGRNTGNPNILGRTATHEVGHWLGLRHIWGDGDCNASDFVDDTPKAIGSNFNCIDTNSCSAEDAYWQGLNPPDMVENYMDYTGDGCMNTFTIGQKSRMQGFLFTDLLRNQLFVSNGCGARTIGVTEIEKEGFILFPNPASDQLSVKSYGQGKFTITDISGSLVLSNTIHSPETQLNIQGLAAGVYLFTLEMNNGQTYRQRLIKH